MKKRRSLRQASTALPLFDAAPKAPPSMPRLRDYPIKRKIDEAECDTCFADLRMGTVAMEDNGLLFCSEDCAREHTQMREFLIEHHRGFAQVRSYC